MPEIPVLKNVKTPKTNFLSVHKVPLTVGIDDIYPHSAFATLELKSSSVQRYTCLVFTPFGTCTRCSTWLSQSTSDKSFAASVPPRDIHARPHASRSRDAPRSSHANGESGLERLEANTTHDESDWEKNPPYCTNTRKRVLISMYLQVCPALNLDLDRT